MAEPKKWTYCDAINGSNADEQGLHKIYPHKQYRFPIQDEK